MVCEDAVDFSSAMSVAACNVYVFLHRQEDPTAAIDLNHQRHYPLKDITNGTAVFTPAQIVSKLSNVHDRGEGGQRLLSHQPSRELCGKKCMGFMKGPTELLSVVTCSTLHSITHKR